MVNYLFVIEMIELNVIIAHGWFLYLRHGNRERTYNTFHNTVDATFVHLVIYIFMLLYN